MSDEFLESIWAQFAVETEEHLETIERILVEMEGSDTGATSEVAILFRAFHSLKGLFGALDMLSLERLAHSAENLLGLVRDGGMLVTPSLISVLLQSVDEMKRLVSWAISQRTDAPISPGLLENMAAMFVQAGGPELYLELAQEVIRSDQAGEDELAFHDDPEMLGFFLDLLQESMAVFAQLLEGAPFQAGMEEEIDATLSTLSRAAESIGFTRIAEVMDALLNLWDTSRHHLTCGSVEHDALAELISDYYQLLIYIEEEAGREGGSQQLAAALTGVMKGRMKTACEVSMIALDRLDDLYIADDDLEVGRFLPDLSEVQQHITSLNSAIRFLWPDRDGALLPLVEDVVARVVQGDVLLQPELFSIARESISRACCDDITDDGDLVARLQRCVWANEDDALRDCSPEAGQAFVASLPMSADVKEALSPENIRELIKAVEEGMFLHEVMVNLERSEDIASDFLDWVSLNGKIVTNTSRFIEGECWYEMLVVSNMDVDTVTRTLKQIDQGQKLLVLRGGEDFDVRGQSGEDHGSATVSSAPAVVPASVRGQSAAIRVQGEVLDNLVKQIGEMVLIRAQLNYIVTAEETRNARLAIKAIISQLDSTIERNDFQERLLLVSEAFEAQTRKLAEVDAQIQSALSRLHESAMAMRVVPMEMVLKRFPRVVRDLAQTMGKSIRLDLLGQEVRIDKAMVEILSDPLLHMVRNSVDHGVEPPDERVSLGKSATANIQINAYQQGAHVVVQLSDDGRGIDPDKIISKAMEKGWVDAASAKQLSLDEVYNFLFVPGFSTAEKVTETSGRGVGMDVIRNNVNKMGGSIHIRSEKGQGTTFTLEMPLSAAVQDVLLVEAADQKLAIPGRYIAEVIEIDTTQIQAIKGREAVLLRGNFLPIVSLADLLGFTVDHDESLTTSVSFRTAMVVTDGHQMVGVEVDKLIGRRELFVKDVHRRLVELPGVGGASVMGDGTIVLILDGDDLLRIAEQMSGRRVLKQTAQHNFSNTMRTALAVT